MKKLLVKLLGATERLYLYTHGWRKVEENYYIPPIDYPAKKKHDRYHRTHAVAAQRQVYANETKEFHP